MRRTLLAATAGVLLAPAPAHAEVRLRATISPTTIHYPRTRSVEYRLHVVGTNRRAVVSVEVFEPEYAVGRGSPIGPARKPVLLGDGRMWFYRFHGDGAPVRI